MNTYRWTRYDDTMVYRAFVSILVADVLLLTHCDPAAQSHYMKIKFYCSEPVPLWPVTDGLPSRRYINADTWCFIWCWMVNLTLNVRGPRYLGLTRSLSWLLMPWLLTSPGHQQPWYWLCRIGRLLSYLRKDLKYLRRINVEKWHKM